MYENTVYPGVENTLAELKRRGYRLAVASAKPTFYVTQIMDHFNLSRYFEVIAGTDLNGPKVTKSQVIEEALERMSLSDHRETALQKKSGRPENMTFSEPDDAGSSVWLYLTDMEAEKNWKRHSLFRS